MKNKRNIGILLAILLVVLLAFFLLGRGRNVKASTVGALESDGQKSIEAMVTEYEREMNLELTLMQNDLALMEKDGSLTAEQLEKLKEKYNHFAGEVRELLAGMKEEVAALEEQKLDKADLATYQEAIAREIAGMKSDLSKVEAKSGENGSGNEKLLVMLGKMEKELTDFRSDYESRNAQMEEEMRAVKAEIGNRMETIFQNYEGGLWKALEDYDKELKKLGQTDSDLSEAISKNQMTLEEMKNTSSRDLTNVHNRLENLDGKVEQKLDITAFLTYQEGMNLSVNSMLKEIDDLKLALQTETTNRVESDEEINRRIDALTQDWNSFQVNGTMTLAQIESSLAALQQVIGNEDISGIGDGTVSGAIASLWEQCGDCRIFYDENTNHFYAEYMEGEHMVLRQLDYMNE